MRKEIKNKAALIRERLTNIARAENIDFDALLLRYFQERFLHRLALSEFHDCFVLKGGLLLICFKMPMARPTKDTDFLAEHIGNTPSELENIFRAIAEMYCDDGVNFDPMSIKSELIKEDADYEGIRIKIDATLGQARKKLRMDIGFGDVVIPEPALMEFPTLLKEKPPKIKVYSMESIVSEKFEAMIKLAMANSRMKDFYDVYTLSRNYSFKGNTLKKAIVATFERRKTLMPDMPFVFRQEFHEDKGRQIQWIAFLRKTKLSDMSHEFSEIMERITSFLKPVVISIRTKSSMEKSWDSISGIWEK